MEDIIRILFDIDANKAKKQVADLAKFINNTLSKTGLEREIPVNIRPSLSFMPETIAAKYPKETRITLPSPFETSYIKRKPTSELSKLISENWPIFEQQSKMIEITLEKAFDEHNKLIGSLLKFDEGLMNFFRSKGIVGLGISLHDYETQAIERFKALQETISKIEPLVPPEKMGEVRNKLFAITKQIRDLIFKIIERQIAWHERSRLELEAAEGKEIPEYVLSQYIRKEKELEKASAKISESILENVSKTATSLEKVIRKTPAKIGVEKDFLELHGAIKGALQQISEDVTNKFAGISAIVKTDPQFYRQTQIAVNRVTQNITKYFKELAELSAHYGKLMKVKPEERTVDWYIKMAELVKRQQTMYSRLLKDASEISKTINYFERGNERYFEAYQNLLKEIIPDAKKVLQWYRATTQQVKKRYPEAIPHFEAYTKEVATEIEALIPQIEKQKAIRAKAIMELNQMRKAGVITQKQFEEGMRVINRYFSTTFEKLVPRLSNATNVLRRTTERVLSDYQRSLEVSLKTQLGFYETETGKRLSWLTSWGISWRIMMGFLNTLSSAFRELKDAQYYWTQATSIFSSQNKSFVESLELVGNGLLSVSFIAARLGYDMSNASRMVYEASQIFGTTTQITQLLSAAMKAAAVAGLNWFEAEQSMFPILKLIGDSGEEANKVLGAFIKIQDKTGVQADMLMKSVSQTADAILGLSRNAEDSKRAVTLMAAAFGVLRKYSGADLSSEVERFLRVLQSFTETKVIVKLKQLGINTESMQAILLDLLKRTPEQQRTILESLGLGPREASVFVKLAAHSKEVLQIYTDIIKNWDEMGDILERRWADVAMSMRVTLNVLSKQVQYLFFAIFATIEPGLATLTRIGAGLISIINYLIERVTYFKALVDKLGPLGFLIKSIFQSISVLLTGILVLLGASMVSSILKAAFAFSHLNSAAANVVSILLEGYRVLTGQVSVTQKLAATWEQIRQSVSSVAAATAGSQPAATTAGAGAAVGAGAAAAGAAATASFATLKTAAVRAGLISLLIGISTFAYQIFTIGNTYGKDAERQINAATKAVQALKDTLPIALSVFLISISQALIPVIKTALVGLAGFITSFVATKVGAILLPIFGALLLSGAIVKFSQAVKSLEEKKMEARIETASYQDLQKRKKELESKIKEFEAFQKSSQLKYYVPQGLYESYKKELELIKEREKSFKAIEQISNKGKTTTASIKAIIDRLAAGDSEMKLDVLKRAYTLGYVSQQQYLEILKESAENAKRTISLVKNIESEAVALEAFTNALRKEEEYLSQKVEALQRAVEKPFKIAEFKSLPPETLFRTKNFEQMIVALEESYSIAQQYLKKGNYEMFSRFASIYTSGTKELVDYMSNFGQTLIDSATQMQAAGDQAYLATAQKAWGYAVALYAISQQLKGPAAVQAKNAAINLAKSLIELGVSYSGSSLEIAKTMVEGYRAASISAVEATLQAQNQILAMAYKVAKESQGVVNAMRMSTQAAINITKRAIQQANVPQIDTKSLDDIAKRLSNIGKNISKSSEKQQDWFEAQMEIFNAIEEIRKFEIEFTNKLTTQLPQPWFNTLKSKLQAAYQNARKARNWKEANRLLGYIEQIRQKELEIQIDLIEKSYKLPLTQAQLLDNKVREAEIQYKIAYEKYKKVLQYATVNSAKAVEARAELLRSQFELQKAKIEDAITRKSIARQMTLVGFVPETRKAWADLQNAIDKYMMAVTLYGAKSLNALEARADVVEKRFNYYKSVLERREQILQAMVDLGMASNQQLANFYQQMIAITSNDLLTQLEYRKKLKEIYDKMNQNIEQAIGMPSIRVPTPYEIRRAFIEKLTQNIQVNINVNNQADLQSVTNTLSQIFQIPGGVLGV